MVVLDNLIYVGGDFTAASTITRNNLAAFDKYTQALTSWDPDANDLVNALWPADNWIYAGGDFTTIGGEARNQGAQVGKDGSIGDWDPDFGTGISATVSDIVVANGIIAVGGTYEVSDGALLRTYPSSSTTQIKR